MKYNDVHSFLSFFFNIFIRYTCKFDLMYCPFYIVFYLYFCEFDRYGNLVYGIINHGCYFCVYIFLLVIRILNRACIMDILYYYIDRQSSNNKLGNKKLVFCPGSYEIYITVSCHPNESKGY